MKVMGVAHEGEAGRTRSVVVAVGEEPKLQISCEEVLVDVNGGKGDKNVQIHKRVIAQGLRTSCVCLP